MGLNYGLQERNYPTARKDRERKIFRTDIYDNYKAYQKRAGVKHGLQTGDREIIRQG